MTSSYTLGNNPGTVSTGLLVQAQQDEALAWVRLVNLYSPLIFYWCRKAGLQAHDAEDVTQNVFLVVRFRMTSFERDRKKGSFRGWLRTITRNKIGDFIRSQRKCPMKLMPASDWVIPIEEEISSRSGLFDQLPPPRELSSEKHILFHRILGLIQTEFTETTWKAFLRVVVDHVSPKEVARELGLSLNAIYLAKSRVLRRIRDEFHEEIPH